MAFNLFGGDTSTSATTSHSDQIDMSSRNTGSVGRDMTTATMNNQGATGQTIVMTDVGATSKALDAAIGAEQILANQSHDVLAHQADLAAGAMSTLADQQSQTVAALADQSNRQTQALADIKGADTIQQRNLIIGVVCVVGAIALMNLPKGKP